jgi:uncharacterized protein YpiB (UPF0302 family)
MWGDDDKVDRIKQNNRKKEYIQWFLHRHHLKSPETAAILQYILENDYLLDRVTIVEDIRYLPDAVLISATDTETVSYLLRLGGAYFEYVQDFLAHLKAFPPDELFVRLSFNKDIVCFHCKERQGAHISDPITGGEIWEIVARLEEDFSAREKQVKEILRLIDGALDAGNREEFIRLTIEYRQLLE